MKGLKTTFLLETQNACTYVEARTDNSTSKKLAAQCSEDTFVVNQTLVLRIIPIAIACASS